MKGKLAFFLSLEYLSAATRFSFKYLASEKKSILKSRAIRILEKSTDRGISSQFKDEVIRAVVDSLKSDSVFVKQSQYSSFRMRIRKSGSYLYCEYLYWMGIDKE
jgi:hypothetical protein